MQSSLSIFVQMYLRKFEDTYSILQNKYRYVYEDSFRAKILRYDSPYLTTSLPTPWPLPTVLYTPLETHQSII